MVAMTSRKRAGGSSARGAALALGLVLVACGGSGPKEPVPVAMLAESLEAGAALRPAIAAWGHGSEEARRATEARLADVVRRFPKEPAARVAEAHLAWIALENGQIARALELARAVEAGPAGSTKNLALVVEGGALRREGKPNEALARLEPLVGKLVDAYARALLDEEVIQAALAAGRWDKALALIGVWLGEAGDDDAPWVRERVERLVDAVPPEALLALLGAKAGAASDDAVRRLVAERLADGALARKDAPLAKRLRALAEDLLGERGAPIAELAADVTAARVEPRTVGLLLSLRSDEARRRGAEVAAGLALGLGLPGSTARLVSRDDRGAADGVVEALGALSADGAAVIVAGLDEAEATTAARFADLEEVPVILLRPPLGGAGARFGFVLGDDPRAVGEALAAALAKRGGAPTAWLGEGAPGGDGTRSARCGEVLPLADWKREGVLGLVVNGSPSCARDAVTATAATGIKLAFGLDAAEAARPGALVATAGVFPVAVAEAPAEPARRGARPPRTAPPPASRGPEGAAGFWGALGRDAGVLAWAGIRALPAKGTEDPAEVRARRAEVGQALAAAEVALWTTEAKGFAGGRVMARAVGVREAR
jgi:hypothetical protein